MFEERGVSKRRAPSSFLFLLENMARYAGYFPDGPVITTNYPDIARNWPKYPYIAEYRPIFSHIASNLGPFACTALWRTLCQPGLSYSYSTHCPSSTCSTLLPTCVHWLLDIGPKFTVTWQQQQDLTQYTLVRIILSPDTITIYLTQHYPPLLQHTSDIFTTRD